MTRSPDPRNNDAARAKRPPPRAKNVGRTVTPSEMRTRKGADLNHMAHVPGATFRSQTGQDIGARTAGKPTRAGRGAARERIGGNKRVGGEQRPG